MVLFKKFEIAIKVHVKLPLKYTLSELCSSSQTSFPYSKKPNTSKISSSIITPSGNVLSEISGKAVVIMWKLFSTPIGWLTFYDWPDDWFVWVLLLVGELPASQLGDGFVC